MLEDYANKNSSQDSSFSSDALLVFECKQALLRKQYAKPNVDAEWIKFSESILATIAEPKKQVNRHFTPKRYFTFGALAGVAAVLLVLVVVRSYKSYLDQRPITIFVAEQRSQEVTIDGGENGQKTAVKNINDPGTGASINTHKADFTHIANTRTHNRTIRTPYGKDYRVVLNDGTEVIMNADSKLTFPTRFSGKERVVTLEGEAYFKVAKNPQMPFLVKTDKMDTRALGTEFNVKAYKNSDPHVTLIEGVVEVNVPDLNKNVRMSPSEEISLTDKTLNIKEVDPEYYTQWKDGFFYYDNIALGEILSDIGRWYNVNIEIDKPNLMEYRLHFVVNRDAKIDDVVDNLNTFRYLNAVKKGNKITIFEKKAHN